MSVTNNSKVESLKTTRGIYLSQQVQLASKGIKTEEQRKAYDDLERAISDINDELDLNQRLSTLQSRVAAETPAPAPLSPSDVRAAVTSSIVSLSTANSPQTETRKREINGAFRSYFKNGGTITPELRDLLVDSDTTGGALMPQEFDSVLTTALHNYANLISFATTELSNTGAEARFPALDDNSAASTIVAEGSTIPETDPSLYSRAVSTDTYASKILVSNQLWQDSDFSIESVVNDLSLARSFRALESSIITGADKASNAAPNSANLLSVVPVAATTSTLSAGIGWTDIMNVIESLDSAYLPFARVFLSSKTKNYLVAKEDSTGRPFFTPDPNEPFGRLCGLPITLTESMPNVSIASGGTASTIPLIIGSMVHGLCVKYSRPSVRVFRETHAEINSTLVQISIRAGSQQFVPQALQALKLGS